MKSSASTVVVSVSPADLASLIATTGGAVSTSGP
jgi:hypothetical protein